MLNDIERYYYFYFIEERYELFMVYYSMEYVMVLLLEIYSFVSEVKGSEGVIKGI